MHSRRTLVTCSRRMKLADCKLGIEEERFLRDVSDAASNVDGAVTRTEASRVLIAYLVSTHGKEKALAMFRDRVSLGQEKYGLLQETIWNGKRDFGSEFDEEAVDAVVYEWSEWRKESGDV